MPKTMKDISADWKELRPLIGNLIGHLTSKEAQLVSMDEAYERGYEKGYNDGFECGQHESSTLEYQKGLEDAWEAARKISREYSVSDMDDLFDVANWTDIYDFSPEAVIEKLKAYDEQKKAEKEIKVGDEVTTGFSTFVVIKTDETQYLGFDRSAVFCKADKCICKKTGRSFSQVSELLKAMEESNG